LAPIGQAESVGRIRLGDEGIGFAGLRGLDHRRVILRPKRVRFVVDHSKPAAGKEPSEMVSEVPALKIVASARTEG
jgi:hypothetical protein